MFSIVMSFKNCAPLDPPTTSKFGLYLSKLLGNFKLFLFPFKTFFRIGCPVNMHLGETSAVFSKATHITSQYLRMILFASPILKSDSWLITGILSICAAITTGTATYPPLEKTISGLIFFNIFFASMIEKRSLNGIKIFFKVIFRTSLTGFIM